MTNDPLIEDLIDRYRAEMIVPPNEHIIQLSQTCLTDQLDDLTADLYVLRGRIDAYYHEQQDRLARGDIQLNPQEQEHLTGYPKGYCLEITRRLLLELNKEVALGDLKSMALLQGFLRQGGTIKRIWGGLRGIYFQNAIQAGSYYVDVANDTVDVTKPQIEILPIDDVDYQQFDNFFDYRKVAEIYWKCRMLPNSFFPNLAPFFPILTFHPDGRIQLESNSTFMFPMNLSRQCAPAHEFLFGAERREAEDEKCRARLMRLMAFRGDTDVKALLSYTPDRDDLRLEAAFARTRNLTPAELAKTVKQVVDVNCLLGQSEPWLLHP